MILPIIDPQLDRGASTNQIPVWNDTTKRFEVSVSLSGLTLVSPVISGGWTWTGLSTANWSDQAKTIQIPATELNFRGPGSLDWWRLNVGGNAINLGNTTDNPDYNFIGSGLSSFGRMSVDDLTANGDITWTGESTLDCTDHAKYIRIDPTRGFTFEAVSGIPRSWFTISAGSGLLDFGNTTDNPTYNFLGTGLTTLGGNLKVNGGFIGDDDDDQLIEINGSFGLVAVDGDLDVSSVIGIGVPHSSSATANIGGARSSDGVYDGILSQLNLDHSGTVTGNQTGISGFISLINANGAVYNDDIVGLSGATQLVDTSGGGGTYDRLVGVAATNTFFSIAGTVQSVIGLDIQSTVTGLATNHYGICINDISGATNNWSIYSLGGNMAHVGNVGIGSTATPTEKLVVAGVIKGESGRQVKTNRLTANTTLDKTYHEVFCNTDGGAFTVTLPVSPADGQTYRITNTGSSGNAITVARNGNLLKGGTADKTASDGTTIILTFEPTEGWW